MASSQNAIVVVLNPGEESRSSDEWILRNLSKFQQPACKLQEVEEKVRMCESSPNTVREESEGCLLWS